MAYRELELTLLSAQDLRSVNLIARMDVYAVVSISGNPLTRQCTAPDTYGGRNPCWNATFRFGVPPTAAAAAGSSLSLHVLLRAERFLGDRDVGEVVVPLSDILAGATGAGPQPPRVASYQVRKVHRWEPRGVLNMSYRLGAVVVPVVERAAADKAAEAAYAPVSVPRHPSHQYPSAVAYQQAPPAPGPPVGRVVAEHNEAAPKKSPVVMAYPVATVGVPQQASHPPTKVDVYRPPTPPPRPAAVHAARHEEAPASAPAPPPRNGGSNGHGQSGPTHIYNEGPKTQIIFGGGGAGAPTTTAGPPTWTTSPARSIIRPVGKKGDGNDGALLTQGNYASAAEFVISPRSRKEDRWRPSQSQQQAASSPGAAPNHRLAAAASPFSSRSSSFSSPLSPYSAAHPSPSSSVHSSNNTFRSHGAVISSQSPSSLPNRSGGAAVSSPLPSSSLMVPNHSI